MNRFLIFTVAVLALCPVKLSQAAGQKAAEPAKPAPAAVVSVPAAPTDVPAPYDGDLARVSEILGSIHYLRNLCSDTTEDHWRASMQQLIDSETNNEPKRRAHMNAAFNRGYRSFASIYATCTPVARVAAERYRNEAATLTGEIIARYGN